MHKRATFPHQAKHVALQGCSVLMRFAAGGKFRANSASSIMHVRGSAVCPTRVPSLDTFGLLEHEQLWQQCTCRGPIRAISLPLSFHMIDRAHPIKRIERQKTSSAWLSAEIISSPLTHAGELGCR